MEVGQAVLALDLVDPELDLAEDLLLVGDEVTEGNLNNTALKRVVRVFWADVRKTLGWVESATY